MEKADDAVPIAMRESAAVPETRLSVVPDTVTAGPPALRIVPSIATALDCRRCKGWKGGCFWASTMRPDEARDIIMPDTVSANPLTENSIPSMIAKELPST